MTDEEKARRGQRAAQIMADDMVKAALDELETRLVAAWKSAPYDDAEGRERLYRQMWAGRAFKAFFEQAMAEGQIAEHRIQQYQRRGEF